MGTVAVIKVEGVNYAKVYKHNDGGVEDTLPWLEFFNMDFTKKRGNDPEYKFAQLLRSSMRDSKKYHLSDSDTIGWGVIRYNENVGESYTYLLRKDGTVSYVEK